MIETSLAHPAHPHEATDLEHVSSIAPRVLRGSTRHLTTDARFAAILEEDFGIPAAEILRALESEPRRQAIEICAWAEKTQEPEKALSNWARKHRKGSHAPPAAGAPIAAGGSAGGTWCGWDRRRRSAATPPSRGRCSAARAPAATAFFNPATVTGFLP